LDTSFGIVCGLMAAGSWGLVDSAATVVSRRVGTLTTSTGMQVGALTVLLAWCAVTGQRMPADGPLVAQAAAVGALAAAGYLLTYQAFRLGPVVVVSPVISAYGGLSVLLAVVLLGESVRPLQAWGVVAATFGVALSGIVLDRQWRRSRAVGRGVPFAIGALFIWAIVVVGLATPIRTLGWLPALTISRLASVVVLVPLRRASSIRTRAAQERGQVTKGHAADPGGETDGSPATDLCGGAGPWPRAFKLRGRTVVVLLLAMGWLDVFGFAVWAIGLTATTAWLVGITGSFGPIVSMTFGLCILGERLRPNQWLGVAVVIASVVLVGSP
jgi:drug/metabolite transporter (DMT)-like permease